MFELTDEIKCRYCGKETTPSNWVGWILEHQNGKTLTGFVCPKCVLTHGTHVGAIQIEKNSEEGDALAPAAPIKGNFKPVKTLAEIQASRPEDSPNYIWFENELDYYQQLRHQYPLFKIQLKGRGWQKLWLSFNWENGRVTSISCVGDLVGKKDGSGRQELDIYQRNRLTMMGLTESGEKDTVWSVTLSDKEQGLDNVARIATHILQYGLLIEAHKITDEILTVDK